MHKKKLPLIIVIFLEGFNSPTATQFVSGGTVPAARTVSLNVHMTDIVLSKRHSHLLVNLGQFIDHDLSLSPEAEVENEEEK